MGAVFLLYCIKYGFENLKTKTLQTTMRKTKKIGIFAGGVAVAILAVVLWQSGVLSAAVERFSDRGADGSFTGEQRVQANQIDDDLEALSQIEQSFGPITNFFVELAREKGGVHAFEVLKIAQFPPDIDLHLLGHSVGDELYKQTGLEGMKYCTHDFRNACSHTIVIGALLEDGVGVLDVVNDVCKEAPGGPGAYTMCFHGFGHGVLAYADYEVPDAVELCKRVGTDEYNNREYIECVGGTIMEMYGGVHDKELWAAKAEKYLDDENPLAMCQADYMPEDAKQICYTYITPFIFDAAGAINGNPRPEIYTEAFGYCDNAEPGINQDTCYAGLGKEFIVLAQDRDIRRIEDTPDEKLALAAGWCELAESKRAQDLCKLEILNSLFWGGENHYNVSLRYCALVTPEALQDECFDRVMGYTSYYQSDIEFREGVCREIPSRYQNECQSRLLQ